MMILLRNGKPIHEKGIFVYLIRQTLPTIVISILGLSVLLLIYRPTNTDTLHEIVLFTFIYIVTLVLSYLLRWINTEKKIQATLQ